MAIPTPNPDGTFPSDSENTTDAAGAFVDGDSEPERTRDLQASTQPATSHSAPFGDIPGYEILGEIARGGMGVILAARDRTLDREVAIKVLVDANASVMATARFLRESKITAQLPHPGIPPIHTLGTLPNGDPFLTMKLIRGRTLGELLKARQMVTQDLPRFLQVFEQIAQAVGFAHGQGIIHRDLKPANVMVGAFGEVQVMDWGLAKSVGSTDAEVASVATQREASLDETLAGSIVGTPAYMAPEQARGESVDARTDVFALGGILSDILTGKPVFGGTSALDTVKQAAKANLADAMARLDVCGADSELIALAKRCLSSRADDRLADGQAVAVAVAAYRGGVEARLRTAERERAAAEAKEGEQRKRRRVQLALAATVALLLFGGGAFAWWQDRQVAQRALRERDEQNRLVRNADAIEEELSRCELALRNDHTDTASAALLAIDQRATEGGADHLRSRMDRCRKDLTVLREFDEIDKIDWMPNKREANPLKQMTRSWATALAVYGITPGQITPAEAAELLRGAYVRDRLLATLELWLLLERSPEIRAILAMADPDPIRERVRSLLFERKGKGLAALVLKITASDQPVWFVRTLGRMPFLPIELQRPLLEKALLRRPGDPITLMALGGMYSINQKEDAEQRLRWYQAALAVNPRNQMAWVHLGISLNHKDDHVGAIASYREAINIDPNFAPAHTNLGSALKNKGELDEAIAAHLEAIRIDPNFAIAHANLSGALMSRDNIAGAIAAGREAIRLDPEFAIAHYNLGAALAKGDDPDGAIKAYEEAVRINPDYANAHFNLAQTRYGKGDTDGAIAAYRAAVRADPKAKSAYVGLGVALKKKGDLDGAIAANQDAVRLDPKDGIALANLAVAYFAKDLLEDAAQSARAAMAANPKYAQAHAALGITLERMGDIPAARLALTQAARLNAKQWGPQLARLPSLETEQMAMGPLDGIFDQDALKIADAVDLRLGVQIARKQLAAAIATAERFARWSETLGPARRTYFYLSALYFARCTPIAVNERDMLIDRTIALLRKAKELGYFDGRNNLALQKNRVLDPIRTHPKFVAFLKEMVPARELLPAPKMLSRQHPPA